MAAATSAFLWCLVLSCLVRETFKGYEMEWNEMKRNAMNVKILSTVFNSWMCLCYSLFSFCYRTNKHKNITKSIFIIFLNGLLRCRLRIFAPFRLQFGVKLNVVIEIKNWKFPSKDVFGEVGSRRKIDWEKSNKCFAYWSVFVGESSNP